MVDLMPFSLDFYDTNIIMYPWSCYTYAWYSAPQTSTYKQNQIINFDFEIMISSDFRLISVDTHSIGFALRLFRFVILAFRSNFSFYVSQ